MANFKSNTQRANEVTANMSVLINEVLIVKNFVLEDSQMKANETYKQLQAAKEQATKAVTEFELAQVKADETYRKLSALVAIQAVRAYGKKYSVPSMCDENFLNSETFAQMIAEHAQYFDTSARLASFVVKVYDSLQVKKVKVTKRIPYTISEIKQLIPLLSLGIMTREELKERIKKGK